MYNEAPGVFWYLQLCSGTEACVDFNVIIYFSVPSDVMLYKMQWFRQMGITLVFQLTLTKVLDKTIIGHKDASFISVE